MEDIAYTAVLMNELTRTMMKFNSSLSRRRMAAAATAVLAVLCTNAEALPHITYTPTYVTTGLDVAGFTVDSAGNVYVASNISGAMLYKETLGNGAYTQTTITTAAVTPADVAVDAAGNLYVVDSNTGNILKETYANGSYTESTAVSGLSTPFAMAIDGGGNLYVSTLGDGHIYKESPSNNSYTQSVIATSTLNSVRAIATDTAGNLYIADSGNNRALKETLQGNTYTESVIASGLDSPLGIAVDSNGVVYIDDTNNYRLLEETPQAGAYIQTVSSAAPQGGTGVAVDGSGDLYYDLRGAVVKAVPIEVREAPLTSFTAASVGAPPSTQIVTFTFDVGGVLGSRPFSVSTQGSATLDFRPANQSAHVCATGTSYATNATCTVAVAFSPTRPGTRYGAVVLYSASGSPIATSYLQGSGIAPQVSFSPGFDTSNIAVVTDANYSSADGIGDVLYNATEGLFLQNVKSGSIVGPIGGSDAPSFGLAIDGAGNIFDAAENVAELQFNPYYAQSAGAPYVGGTSLSSSAAHPGETGGVVVDGAGNVYFTDTANNALFVATFSGGGYDVTSIGSGLSGPTSLAIDAGGSVYLADTGNNRILKESFANGSYTQSVLIAGISVPSAIAVDNMDNLYVAQATSVLKETLFNGTYQASTAVPYSGIVSIATDPSGNVYLDGCGLEACSLTEIDVSDAPMVQFAATAVGGISSDSPQTVTVVNNGNAPLTFVAPGTTAPITAGFTISSRSTCPVLPGSSRNLTLVVGASCTLLVNFSPTVSGAVNGTLTLTDDTLNAPGSTQVIHLNGTGTGTGSGGGTPAPTAQITLTPMNDDFGTVSAGAAASTTFVLANVGTIAVNIASTSLPSAVFAVTSSTCGASLAVAASCNYVVTFTPTSAGAQSATFSVTDDAGTQSAALTGSSGAAAAPQAVLTPASGDFGSIAVGGSSAVQAFTLSNAGNAALAISSVVVGGTNAAEFAIASDACGNSLAAGATCAITVNFSPNSAGSAAGTLTVADNAASATQTALLTGNAAPADFALKAAPTTQTASAGSSVSYTVNVASVAGTFGQAVGLTAGNLPPGATVSFSPAAVTPGSHGASAIMTVQTATPTAMNQSPSMALPIGIPLFAVLWVVPFSKRRRTLARFSCAMAIAVIVASLPGCGGGFALPQTPTMAQTYTITITGTAGSLQHAASVQLTLQ